MYTGDDYTALKSNQNDDCEFLNSMLLNKICALLHELVENKKLSNRKISNGKPLKSDNWVKVPDYSNQSLEKDDLTKPKPKIYNIYNNNTGSNKLNLCDCDKITTNESSYCPCINQKECILQEKRNELNKPKLITVNTKTNNVQQDSINVNQVKQKQVDFGCQCVCHHKDSSTQDDSIPNFKQNLNLNSIFREKQATRMKSESNPNLHYFAQEERISEINHITQGKQITKKEKTQSLNKCICANCGMHTHLQYNSMYKNVCHCLINDPNTRGMMNMIPCSNIVLLSNGCTCCNKCNIPLDKTSVTTNTSNIILPSQEEKSTVPIISKAKPRELYQEDNFVYEPTISKSGEIGATRKLSVRLESGATREYNVIRKKTNSNEDPINIPREIDANRKSNSTPLESDIVQESNNSREIDAARKYNNAYLGVAEIQKSNNILRESNAVSKLYSRHPKANSAHEPINIYQESDAIRRLSNPVNSNAKPSSPYFIRQEPEFDDSSNLLLKFDTSREYSNTASAPNYMSKQPINDIHSKNESKDSRNKRCEEIKETENKRNSTNSKSTKKLKCKKRKTVKGKSHKNKNVEFDVPETSAQVLPELTQMKLDKSFCFNEETCRNLLNVINKFREEIINCDKTNCEEIHRLATALAENDETFSTKRTRSATMQTKNEMNCDCKDIHEIAAKIAELCNELNSKKNNGNNICDCSDKNTRLENPAVPKDNIDVEEDECQCELICSTTNNPELQYQAMQNKSESKLFDNYIENTNKISFDEKVTNCNLANCPKLNPLETLKMYDKNEQNTKQYDCRDFPTNNNSITTDNKKGKKDKLKITKTGNKHLKEVEITNLDIWTQEYPEVTCNYCPCDTELIENAFTCHCDEVNMMESYSCNLDAYPDDVHHSANNCCCDSENCYYQNLLLNEIKTNAKLECLADQVVDTLTSCNCSVLHNSNSPFDFKYNIDLAKGKSSTRQVCFASNCHEKNLSSLNRTANGMCGDVKSKCNKIKNTEIKSKNQSFKTNFTGVPCLRGSKSVANLCNYNLHIKKGTARRLSPCVKKTLKQFTVRPILPLPEAPRIKINYPVSLYSEINRVLLKLKQLSKWDKIPQELVEIVVDRILKREIKYALHCKKYGIKNFKSNGAGDEVVDNILNLLQDEKKSLSNLKKSKNNLPDKSLEKTKLDSNTKKSECSLDSNSLHVNSLQSRNSINICDENMTSKQNQLETLEGDAKIFALNRKPILVQTNVEKKHLAEIENEKYNVRTEYIVERNLELNEEMPASPIYITENKLESIKELITIISNKKNEGNESFSSSASIVSLKEENHPISLNINIKMDRESLKLNTINSSMNTEEPKRTLDIETQADIQNLSYAILENKKAQTPRLNNQRKE